MFHLWISHHHVSSPDWELMINRLQVKQYTDLELLYHSSDLQYGIGKPSVSKNDLLTLEGSFYPMVSDTDPFFQAP